MDSLSGYPYWELQFTRNGTLFNSEEVKALEAGLRQQSITDLFVISHGWNNDMNEARDLYKKLIAAISSQQKASGVSTGSFGVVGVLWPSKKFADKDLTAGGGSASISNIAYAGEQDMLLEQIENLKGFFDKDEANDLLQKAQDAVRKMNDNADVQGVFVKHMNKLLDSYIEKNNHHAEEEGVDSFSGANPEQLLIELGDEWNMQLNYGGGAAGTSLPLHASDIGGAAGGSFSFGGVFSGAHNLLNFVTYYQMKERAGKTGNDGLYPLLAEIQKINPNLKLHLIGHSFGGRLVTAAIAGSTEQSILQVNTLILLQAAFSHYGFSEGYDGSKNGFFRRVVKDRKVKGPILITHTKNDKAVGLAYTIASRIAKQVGSSLGDKNDFYGGMGGNGAQITPEANNLYALSKTTKYMFKEGKVYNLNGDSCITGHSDICKVEVARAIVSAIG